jgi:tetratricopeptide (TPR) repeat protein
LASIFLYLLFIELLKTPAMLEVESPFSKKLAAFFAAGIFLLHPLQTESVTYVIQRAESMAGMFYLATLYFYIKARLGKTAGATLRYGILAGFSALGAAFSKETGVTLPAMIAIFEVLLFETSIKELLRNKIFLALLVPAALVVFYKLGPLLQRNFFYDPEIRFTREQYLLTQFSVLLTYLRLFFFPVGQNLDWDFPVASIFFAPVTVLSFLALLAMIALAFLIYRRFRLLSLGIIGFFIILAPTSSIIPIKDVLFEHRMYLAVGFLAIGVVQVVFAALNRVRQIPIKFFLTAASCLLVFSLLAGLTFARNQVWGSEVSLWRDTVEKSPNKYRPHLNYGLALYKSSHGSLEMARDQFEIAHRLCPECPKPIYNLSCFYFDQGDYQRALGLAIKLLEQEPDSKLLLHHLGKICIKLERWDEARTYLERVMALPPDSKFSRAYLDLLVVYLKLDLRGEAVSLAEYMASLPDNSPDMDYYRGRLFFELQDYDRARLYFQRQAGDKYAIASLLMLGNIFYLQGEYGKAQEAFEKILDRRPWSPKAHYNLSVIMERSNRLAEARKHLEIVVGIQAFSLAPRIRLIGLYDHLGEYKLRSEAMRSLLGLRSDSPEFSFLKGKEDGDLDVTLHDYAGRFLSGNAGNSPGGLEKTKAMIATLGGDLAGAINWYEKYLPEVDDLEEINKVEKEILRLETILRGGKEPLEVPA